MDSEKAPGAMADDAFPSNFPSKPNCRDAVHRVYEYIDGELTMWRRVAITRHLDECPPCADGFTFELELRRVVISKCHEEVPADLKARIAAALGIVVEPED